jgi:hypothetical protein
VQATGLIEDATAVRHALPGVSLSVMAPMGGKHPADLWGVVWRDPRGGLCEGARETRFRTPVLLDRVLGWFVGENFRSFTVEPLRERGDMQRVARLGFERELLVRHDWSIAAVVAEPAAASLADRMVGSGLA